ncbi:hypothetical protein QYF36_024971 [Acer negundo]|nr:hypothetical protein QYF36_024971 [Acer negundo]
MRAYVAHGETEVTRHVFDEITEKNVVSFNVVFFNVMIRSNANNHLFRAALLVFKTMSSCGFEPNNYTYPCLLKACFGLNSLWVGLQIHKAKNHPTGLSATPFDGVDFDIKLGSTLHYDDLVRFLLQFNEPEKRVYITRAPQCLFPDRLLGATIETVLFDAIWVQFYNNQPCQYSLGSAQRLLQSWERWASSVVVGKLFMGLPAAPATAGSGYIPP